MAKAKLSDLTEKWISGKAEKQKNTNSKKTKKQQDILEEKIRQTVYVSKKVNRLLWINRINTGKSVSKMVEELVLKYLKDNQIKEF